MFEAPRTRQDLDRIKEEDDRAADSEDEKVLKVVTSSLDEILEKEKLDFVEETSSESSGFPRIEIEAHLGTGTCISESSDETKETSVKTENTFDVTELNNSLELTDGRSAISTNEAKESTVNEKSSFLDPGMPFVPELNLDSLLDSTISSFRMTDEDKRDDSLTDVSRVDDIELTSEKSTKNRQEGSNTADSVDGEENSDDKVYMKPEIAAEIREIEEFEELEKSVERDSTQDFGDVETCSIPDSQCTTRRASSAYQIIGESALIQAQMVEKIRENVNNDLATEIKAKLSGGKEESDSFQPEISEKTFSNVSEREIVENEGDNEKIVSAEVSITDESIFTKVQTSEKTQNDIETGKVESRDGKNVEKDYNEKQIDDFTSVTLLNSVIFDDEAKIEETKNSNKREDKKSGDNEVEQTEMENKVVENAVEKRIDDFSVTNTNETENDKIVGQVDEKQVVEHTKKIEISNESIVDESIVNESQVITSENHENSDKTICDIIKVDGLDSVKYLEDVESRNENDLEKSVDERRLNEGSKSEEVINSENKAVEETTSISGENFVETDREKMMSSKTDDASKIEDPNDKEKRGKSAAETIIMETAKSQEEKIMSNEKSKDSLAVAAMTIQAGSDDMTNVFLDKKF